MPPSDPLAAYSIGLKLHTLRTAKGLTLSRLSAHTGLSTALLSKLETDHMVPTLQTLERICRVYGISLGHFFCQPQLHYLAITRGAHLTPRRVDQTQRATPLHVPTPEAQLVSQVIELPAGVSSTFGECGAKSELSAYIIAGTLHATIAGSTEVLQPGDNFVVLTDQPILWTADKKSSCRILIVSARPSPGQSPNKEP